MSALASEYKRWKKLNLWVKKLRLLDTGNDHEVTLEAGSESADRTLSIPVLGGNDTLMTLATAQTVTGAKTFSGGVVRAGQIFKLSGPPKVGATAGWVVNAAANLYEATLPASQTASTLVVPINGLPVGATITAFQVQAQIESAGGAVTLDAALRKLTNASGDPADAEVGAIGQVSVTADTKVQTQVGGLTEVVAADEFFYVLLTATTAASTDIRFLGINVTLTTA